LHSGISAVDEVEDEVDDKDEDEAEDVVVVVGDVHRGQVVPAAHSCAQLGTTVLRG
jgi:hypothetical protein